LLQDSLWQVVADFKAEHLIFEQNGTVMLKGRNWVLKSREMESWKKGSVKFLANFFRQKSILAEIFFWSNFLW